MTGREKGALLIQVIA